MKKSILLIIFSLISILLINSCQDDDGLIGFEEEYYVEMFLIVNEPIRNLRLFRTQPIEVEYSLENAIVRDATVKIIKGNEEYVLDFVDDDLPGYDFADQSILIEEQTEYRLEITTADGKVMTGGTVTPQAFDWVSDPPDLVNFPTDTVNFPSPDSLRLSWTKSEGKDFYIINVLSLDTLEYGIYLDPPTEELNRRTPSLFNDNEDLYQDLATSNLIANTETPTVWLAFKWFGRNEVAVFAGDDNYLEWYIQFAGFGGNFYDQNLNSIKGDGFGVFGSTAVIRDTMFLIKNQP